MSSRLLSRLKVIAGATLNSLVTAGRRQRSVNPARILVAHHLLLGDTLMLTPLLAKLRQAYPDASIVMTVPGAIHPLYATRPYGVQAVSWNPRDKASVDALLAMGGFDLAIVPGDNRFSWLARAAGARWIVAFSDDHPAWKNWPVDELVPYPEIPAAWGDMVAQLVPGAPPAPYHPDQWPAPPCDPFSLPDNPRYAVLHVGASSHLKQWPSAHWQAVAEYLENQGLQVVWSGGASEKRLVQDIDPAGIRMSYAGLLDLPQMWRLLQRATLLVCPDTGVAHLGRLVHTPTVTLFGPGSPVICGAGDFWRDSPFESVFNSDVSCRDQHILFRRQIPWVQRCGRSVQSCRNDRQCMTSLSPGRVISSVNRLLDHAAV